MRTSGCGARIYRSLGQQPMVAAVHALLDGLADPHPFARAQAARSLGWIGAPVGVDQLSQIAGSEDSSFELRRAARQAVERITAYWLLYGEPRPCATDVARWRFETAQQLASRGLPRAACDFLDEDPDPSIDRGAHRALSCDLRAFVLEPYGATLVDHEREAQEIEAVVAQTDPDHELDDMMALYAVSKHHRGVGRAADLATAPGAIGWNARRALRALLLPRNPDGQPTTGSSYN